MSHYFGFDPAGVTFMRRAALLHDIGKLGVSNSILEKPAKLTGDEFDVIMKHPRYSYEILRRVPVFSELSEVAASHHEKLDGSGYFRGITAAQMPLTTRMLVVADIYDALAARRPYRDAMPLDQVFSILRSEAPHKLDASCVEALIASHDRTTQDRPLDTESLLGLSEAVSHSESLVSTPSERIFVRQ
jgi:putative nucleotidyltransferase with HDIG domain